METVLQQNDRAGSAVKCAALIMLAHGSFPTFYCITLQYRGHPNICGLRENFDEGNYFYFSLDLVSF